MLLSKADVSLWEFCMDKAHTDPEQVRLTLRSCASSVCIVTARCGNDIRGMTATAMCSISLAPPLLLVCVIACTRTHTLIAQSG